MWTELRIAHHKHVRHRQPGKDKASLMKTPKQISYRWVNACYQGQDRAHQFELE